mgnify:FL=1
MWIARIDVVEKLSDNSEKMVTTTLYLNNNLKKLYKTVMSVARERRRKSGGILISIYNNVTVQEACEDNVMSDLIPKSKYQINVGSHISIRNVAKGKWVFGCPN